VEVSMHVYQQMDEYDTNHRDFATPDDIIGDDRMYARVNDPLFLYIYSNYI
jgi:hypothetical protein